ncbi:hypothetical protein GCM10009544_31690 [Streptomyces stramineus]|uniref:Uncharacterized protein n=1 Tax=Streptomyces stramineus TaxID=173861 RepID=A0ABP3JYN6_9ACTN
MLAEAPAGPLARATAAPKAVAKTVARDTNRMIDCISDPFLYEPSLRYESDSLGTHWSPLRALMAGM